jgi:hypothetical protein
MPTPALLRRLPAPSLMRSHLRTLAMLDAVVSPAERSFEYHPGWRKNEQLGAFKDAEGDCFFAWFCARGAVIRGFAHESPMSPYRERPPRQWPALWDGLPAALAYAKTEPAFGGDDVTFACWATDQETWRAGNVKPPAGKDPDGFQALLFGCFSSNFHRWAEDYYDQEFPRKALADFRRPDNVLVHATLVALNRDFDLRAVRQEAAALDWPINVSKTQETTKSSPSPTPMRAEGIPSFGDAEFLVRCESDRIVMLVHGKKVVAEAKVNIYEELFDLVRARLRAASKG